MRILFVSNLYPPHARGGYEQWCEEVALALAARGHKLCILTARPSGGGPAPQSDAQQPFPIYRLLSSEVEGGLAQTALRLISGVARAEAANLRHTNALVAEFRPDAALIWGMWNISRRVPQQLETLLGGRLGYYFCDYWPSLPSAYVQRLQEPARRRALQMSKAALARCFLPRLPKSTDIVLHFPRAVCVSRAVCETLNARGVHLPATQVIYGGTALAEHMDNAGSHDLPQDADEPLRLLYLGRLEPIKGVHTVLDAMRLVGSDLPVTLDIVGAGDPDYVRSLQAQVQEHGLAGSVRFCGPAPYTQVPAILAEHNVLVFPSEWEEPFARSVLEAMAVGLAVVGSTTGGTGEILIEGETGLTFDAGNGAALAHQIRRLVQDPALRRRLAASGRAAVRQRFTLRRMVDEFEAALYMMAGLPVQAPVQA